MFCGTYVWRTDICGGPDRPGPGPGPGPEGSCAAFFFLRLIPHRASAGSGAARILFDDVIFVENMLIYVMYFYI